MNFEGRVLNYDVVRKILYERIINFFTKKEEYLRAKYLEGARGRIKGGATGAIAPGPPLQGVPRDDKYLF